MKARIINKDIIIDVKQGKSGGYYFVDKDYNPYHISDLDFNVGQEETEIEQQQPFFGLFESMNKMNEQSEEIQTAKDYRTFQQMFLMQLVDLCAAKTETLDQFKEKILWCAKKSIEITQYFIQHDQQLWKWNKPGSR